MQVTDFDYYLPAELIAQVPLEPRHAARLLVMQRQTGAITHHHFSDLPSLIQPGDCLVVNDSRVIPARLLGRRLPGGGVVELLLLHRKSVTHWEALVRPGRRLRPGVRVVFGEGELVATIEDTTAAGGRLVGFTWQGESFEAVLNKLGQMPLPPYIKEKLADPERYQTVYSKVVGSAAAPTAGLHFTPELLHSLLQAGVSIEYITLHVGLGTFRPVQVDVVEEHVMHHESFVVNDDVATRINAARQAGGRIIAVGTTTARTLETQVDNDGHIKPGIGETDIFVYPGYQFKAIDGLITNFHLPKSTLIMLVSAFATRERVMAAYAEAVRLRYRFFSFGDAMLLI